MMRSGGASRPISLHSTPLTTLRPIATSLPLTRWQTLGTVLSATRASISLAELPCTESLPPYSCARAHAPAGPLTFHPPTGGEKATALQLRTLRVSEARAARELAALGDSRTRSRAAGDARANDAGRLMPIVALVRRAGAGRGGAAEPCPAPELPHAPTPAGGRHSPAHVSSHSPSLTPVPTQLPVSHLLSKLSVVIPPRTAPLKGSATNPTKPPCPSLHPPPTPRAPWPLLGRLHQRWQVEPTRAAHTHRLRGSRRPTRVRFARHRLPRRPAGRRHAGSLCGHHRLH
jgi:hypothetical protein